MRTHVCPGGHNAGTAGDTVRIRCRATLGARLNNESRVVVTLARMAEASTSDQVTTGNVRHQQAFGCNCAFTTGNGTKAALASMLDRVVGG